MSKIEKNILRNLCNNFSQKNCRLIDHPLWIKVGHPMRVIYLTVIFLLLLEYSHAVFLIWTTFNVRLLLLQLLLLLLLQLLLRLLHTIFIGCLVLKCLFQVLFTDVFLSHMCHW
jgi:hypothetical protein